MFVRLLSLTFLSALMALSAGCKKEATPVDKSKTAGNPSTQSATAAPNASTLARVHWLGKKRLAAETNATAFMAIWNLPESARLEKQTLDKLAMAPWLMVHGTEIYDPKSLITNYQAYYTNYPAATLLRPLLDDLIQEESYLEIQTTTDQPGELALAIKLNDQRAALWQTNLAAALELITGAKPAPSPAGGWTLQLSNAAPALLKGAAAMRLSRAGEWTFLAVVWKETGALTALTERVQPHLAGAPATQPGSNTWLEVQFDLKGILRAARPGWKLSTDMPQVHLVVAGDGANVRTRGELTFAEPFLVSPGPWNIPTNMVFEPLVSFTASRNSDWLKGLLPWKREFGPIPDQLFVWSQVGAPFLTFFAAPTPDANSWMKTFSEAATQDLNPHLAALGAGAFQVSEKPDGLRWAGVPFISPNLHAVETDGTQFIAGGLIPNGPTNRLAPGELFGTVVAQPSLIYYDWEVTGPKVEIWMYLGQYFRLAFHHAQLPPESVSVAWLKASGPRLGNTVTTVRLENDTELTLLRKSALGLTGLDLQLLADWLESPRFPVGSHTTVAPEPHRGGTTNSPAAFTNSTSNAKGR